MYGAFHRQPANWAFGYGRGGGFGPEPRKSGRSVAQILQGWHPCEAPASAPTPLGWRLASALWIGFAIARERRLRPRC